MIATPSPIPLSFQPVHIDELSETGIATVAYDDAETVVPYRSFLSSPEAFLRHLSDAGDA